MHDINRSATRYINLVQVCPDNKPPGCIPLSYIYIYIHTYMYIYIHIQRRVRIFLHLFVWICRRLTRPQHDASMCRWKKKYMYNVYISRMEKDNVAWTAPAITALLSISRFFPSNFPDGYARTTQKGQDTFAPIRKEANLCQNLLTDLTNLTGKFQTYA